MLKRIDFFSEEAEYIAIVKDGAGVGRLLLCEAKSSVLGTLDIIRNNHYANLHFLFYLLGTVDFSRYVTGSTIPHIYFKDYAKEQVALPTLEEQNRIAALLIAIDKKIEIEEKLMKQYEQQKSYLLQNLFI